uniref:Uncharacterized protein n=1 Tax=Romanomermis culicivorax TaxID=13658 RepID=A0A915LCN5_ROMCU
MTDGNLQPKGTERKFPFRSVTLFRLHSVPFRFAEKASSSSSFLSTAFSGNRCKIGFKEGPPPFDIRAKTESSVFRFMSFDDSFFDFDVDISLASFCDDSALKKDSGDFDTKPFLFLDEENLLFALISFRDNCKAERAVFSTIGRFPIPTSTFCFLSSSLSDSPLAALPSFKIMSILSKTLKHSSSESAG